MDGQAGLELRILSGLHRGASLPLGGERYVIGASDDADVVLLDPGVAGRHATLRHDGEHWLLAALEGSVHGAASEAALEEHALLPGESLRIGAVWLGVSAAGAPWTDAPPQTFVAASIPAPAARESGQDAIDPPPAGKPRKRRRRALLLPALAGTVLAGAASLALSARPDPAPAPIAQAAAPVAPVAAPAPPSPADLGQAFRKRLADVDMLPRFDLQLDEGSWRIKGALDEEETLRFRRILAEFVKTNHIAFPIDVQLGGADSLLPFQIQQLVTGNQASIVTSDGQRLYPGDEYKGVRLTAIEGNRISFAGREPIEVRW